jgi:hypothetical protein
VTEKPGWYSLRLLLTFILIFLIFFLPIAANQLQLTKPRLVGSWAKGPLKIFFFFLFLYTFFFLAWTAGKASQGLGADSKLDFIFYFLLFFLDPTRPLEPGLEDSSICWFIFSSCRQGAIVRLSLAVQFCLCLILFYFFFIFFDSMHVCEPRL